jgi:hypothetical protein
MRPTRKVSRATWAGLTLSLLVGTSVWIVALWLQPFQLVEDSEMTLLNAERSRLQGNDDQTRDALRRQYQSVRREAWTESRLATLKSRIGPDWQWTSIPNDQRRLGLTLPPGVVRPWARVVAAVSQLESQSGVIIESLTLAAEGRGATRRLSRVDLRLLLEADGPPSSKDANGQHRAGP